MTAAGTTWLTLVIAVVVLAWLAALTATLLRWRRRQGEPVYRRLRNGRLRFEWSVNRAYLAAREARAAMATQTSPIPVVTPAGRGRASHLSR